MSEYYRSRQHGIGIDFKNMADPVIMLYRFGAHLGEGMPWQVPFSSILLG